jgi:hypothetical protein
MIVRLNSRCSAAAKGLIAKVWKSSAAGDHSRTRGRE